MVGSTVWPGDLCGIDQKCNLLIIEAKVVIRDARTGRFGDPWRSDPSPAALRERRAGLYNNERTFITAQRQLLREGRLQLNLYPGMLPYSRRCGEARRSPGFQSATA